MCRRRLAHEHRGAKRYGNSTADGRFEVSNRLLEDARLAQAEPGAPRTEAFVEPADLEPEQRHLYRAAVRGYLEVFGDRAGKIVDLGWTTTLPADGVDLVANPGLAVELPGGERELRVVHLGRGGRRSLLDPIDVKVALVRTADWAPEQLRIVAVDVLDLAQATYEPRLPDERDEARAWVAERVEIVTRLARDATPWAGADCQGCAFVAGCNQHAG